MICQKILRDRKEIPEKCSGCVLVTECGGGCPLVYLQTIDNKRKGDSNANPA